MKISKTVSFPAPQDLRSEVIRVLIEQLGITKAAFFIRDNFSSPTNYLMIKDKLFAGKKAQKIYENIQMWRADKKKK